ncbi:MAG: SDR family NAD(P)-dependent oxidoreductase [Syntrophorhabdales bacterium]|jgi:NAD(P)-dependent dehydrogenase (short-subunit alcohol dehydrogenase family)
MAEQILSGRTAIVTGGAKGLGRAIAFELAARGASVVIADVDGPSANQVVEEIGKKGAPAIGVLCDLRKEADVQEMVKKTLSAFSKIDILVNNAGLGKVAPLWETPTDVWDETMGVNLRGSYLCIKYVIPQMIQQKAGRVINMSSAVGRQAQPLMGAYAISKAGQIAMTVALAKEVAPYGITVNAVCPGPVETPWWDENRKALAPILNVPENEVTNWFTQQKQAIKVPLKPEDIARVVAWLASDDTNMITGQLIGIDGGHDFPTY